MKRQIIKIDEDKCTGCGDCIPNCHEGALQMIDGKARLISDLFCDGLGACIGHCPEGAISIEEREAEPYNEKLVMEQMVQKGPNTISAHIKHLHDHKEFGFLREAFEYLDDNDHDIPDACMAIYKEVIEPANIIRDIFSKNPMNEAACGGGCPGSLEREIEVENADESDDSPAPQSELRQWPVQLHLLNPAAGYFRDADVLLAADCTAFAAGDFHSAFLKGKTLAIACPKLDQGIDSYVAKLTSLIRDANIRSLTVMMMEVPCCGGLMNIVQVAMQEAGKPIPLKRIILSVEGKVLEEREI